MNLTELGWNPFFRDHFEEFAKQGYAPARVVREHTQIYAVHAESGEFAAEVVEFGRDVAEVAIGLGHLLGNGKEGASRLRRAALAGALVAGAATGAGATAQRQIKKKPARMWLLRSTAGPKMLRCGLPHKGHS